MLTFENAQKARERSKEVQEIEYVKNCVVKYLESNDEKVCVCLCVCVCVLVVQSVFSVCEYYMCVCVCARYAWQLPPPSTYTHIIIIYQVL
jgi:hypothetical protein